MFHFREKADRPIFGVLIDISSGSVGVGIVASIPENKLPELVYIHRTHMRVTLAPNNDKDDWRRIRETLFSSALLLTQDGMSVLRAKYPKAQISRMFITCSSPWAYTIARDVQYESKEPFKVTKEMLDDLVENVEAEIMQALREEAQGTRESYQIVERATVDLNINGYSIHNPLNLKGSEISFSHVTGLIPQTLISFLFEAQEKLFPGTTTRIHTFMLVMYCVLRDIFPRMHTHCIIDVTGEATEFGIVENNLLIENTYIPYGSNTLVRNIMERTNKPAADIEGLLAAAHAQDSVAQEDFKAEIENYEGMVQAAISEILGRRVFPHDVIITTHTKYESLFKGVIARALKQSTDIQSNVISIEPKLISEITQTSEADVYLVLAARFFHKLHGCGE